MSIKDQNGETSSIISRIKIIGDEPADSDTLGFDKYSNYLSTMIINSTPQFTVGIFGGWGTGKTTLMKMIKKELEKEVFKDDIIIIWFDAWRYENEKYLAIIPLIRSIKIGIDNKLVELSTLNKDISKGFKDLKDSITKTFHGFIESAKINATLNSIVTSGIELDVEKFTDILKSKGSVIINNTKVYYHNQHITDDLSDAIDEFVKENKSKRRIVIFIDDLDRCFPERALELLESIKTFFDINGIIYILGMDPQSINSIIRKKYGENPSIDANNYLQKIIQLQFHIPLLNPTDLDYPIKKILQSSGFNEKDIDHIIRETTIKLIIGAARLNLRDIKRFINTIALSKYVFEQEIEIEKLIAVQAFYFHGNKWIDFLKLLIPYKDRISFLRHFIISIKKEKLTNLENLIEHIKNNSSELPKNILYIYNKLFEINDYDLFNFLIYASETLIKIDRIEKVLGVIDNKFIQQDRLNSNIDNTYLIKLLKNKNVEEFNKLFFHKSYFALQEWIRHFPFESFYGLHLDGVSLWNSCLFMADLTGSKLTSANLKGSDLSGAKIYDANLSNARLTRIDLSWADIMRTDFSNSDLSGANLTNSKFIDVNLSGCDLSGANLTNAILINPINIQNLIIENAILANTLIINKELVNDLKRKGIQGFQNPLNKSELEKYMSDKGISESEKNIIRNCSGLYNQ